MRRLIDIVTRTPKRKRYATQPAVLFTPSRLARPHGNGDGEERRATLEAAQGPQGQAHEQGHVKAKENGEGDWRGAGEGIAALRSLKPFAV